MTEYPSIDPADVREGDVVEADYDGHGGYTVRGEVYQYAGKWYCGRSWLPAAKTIRLVSRPTPPEPPLRVGDWVRWPNGNEFQMTDVDRGFRHHPNATRIEPPVGSGVFHWPDSTGQEVCAYDDAVRAVAEAEQRGVAAEQALALVASGDDVERLIADAREANRLMYEQGQRDMLVKAIAAVEALEPIYRAYPHRFVRVSDILAALRALPLDGGE